MKKAPKEYVEYKKKRKDFKDKLVSFAERATEETKHKNIICFIDELDRCRPTFAIELLENIKHFLNVESYIFIIALDKNQLGISIGSLYGSNMDTEGYLKRFIDITYSLKQTSTRQYTKTVFEEIFQESFEERIPNNNFRNQFYDFLETLTRGFNLTLRELEQLIFHLKLISKSIRYNDEVEFYIVPVLIILRTNNYEIYEKYMKHEISFSSIIGHIENEIDWINLFPYQPFEDIKSRMYTYLELLHLSKDQLIIKRKDFETKLQEEKDNHEREDYEKFIQIAGRIGTLPNHPRTEIYNMIESITVLDT